MRVEAEMVLVLILILLLRLACLSRTSHLADWQKETFLSGGFPSLSLVREVSSAVRAGLISMSQQQSESSSDEIDMG